MIDSCVAIVWWTLCVQSGGEGSDSSLQDELRLLTLLKSIEEEDRMASNDSVAHSDGWLPKLGVFSSG